MAVTTLLAATTSATQSAEFDVNADVPVTVRVQSAAHAGAETSQIQYRDALNNWLSFSSLRSGTTAMPGQFSVSVNAIPIYEAGRYRVNKGATAGAVGFELSVIG